jgi:hypothetical protein
MVFALDYLGIFCFKWELQEMMIKVHLCSLFLIH